MHGYAFNIGDLLRIKPGTIDYITTPADPDKHYTHSLRVEFRFWDGKQNVYVVTAEDGITMFIIEDSAEFRRESHSGGAGTAGRVATITRKPDRGGEICRDVGDHRGNSTGTRHDRCIIDSRLSGLAPMKLLT